tara:strand:- start:684 stop:1274 length:591 start_codon:yes stop_codon:yes gene_type:complete
MITSVEFGIILENITRLLGDEFNKEQFQRFLNKNANLIAVGDWKMRDIEPNKFYIQYFRATDNLESIRIIGGIENQYFERFEIFGHIPPELASSLKVGYYQLHLPAFTWPKTLLWDRVSTVDELVQTTRGTFKFNKERHNLAYQSDRDYGSDEVDRFKWNGWVHNRRDELLIPFEVWELPINFGTDSIISLNYPLR